MPEKGSIKAVLDTNIFISSIFWTGNPHAIVNLALNKKITVYTSPAILTELEKVLQRDFKEDREFVERQIALILDYAELVRPLHTVSIVNDDPDDNKIIECALTAKAGYIVSGDPHLTNLKEVLGIKIVTPAIFMNLMR